MTADINKLIKSPEVTYDYDKKLESLLVTVELPGVKQDAFELNLAACGFCISAETTDIQYHGCYKFLHEVDCDEAKVKLKNGTLSIRLPFFEPMCGKQFPMELP